MGGGSRKKTHANKYYVERTVSTGCCGHWPVGQNQWYHFGAGAPPILVYFGGDWDVDCGYWVLTHGHLCGAPTFFARGEVSTLGSLKGRWKWHGGALGVDGAIYGIPAHAERVLKIVPETGEVTLIGGRRCAAFGFHGGFNCVGSKYWLWQR